MGASSSTELPSVGDGRLSLTVVVQLLKDSLDKELDSVLFPADAAKKAAFDEWKTTVSRDLPRLTAQVAELDSRGAVNECFLVLREFWAFLRRHHKLLRIPPWMMESSLFAEVLSTLFEAAVRASNGEKGRLLKGGLLILAAVIGIGADLDTPLAADVAAHLAALLARWSDSVCSKRWHVEDGWGVYNFGGQSLGPLHQMARFGLASFVPLAIARGCPVNGDFSRDSALCPGAIAFRGGHFDVLDALFDAGLDVVTPYKEDGYPLAMLFFELGKEGHVDFLADLLRKRPEAVNARCSRGADTDSINLLAAAIGSKSRAVVDIALTAGAPIEYSYLLEGVKHILQPTLYRGIMSGQPDILELLLEKAKLLDNWEAKYDQNTLSCISLGIARLAATAYPISPHFKGRLQGPLEYNPKALECLEMVLASGIVCPWEWRGFNTLHMVLYPTQERENRSLGCVFEEPQALALLKRFHAAGFDVFNSRLPSTIEDWRRGTGIDIGLAVHTLTAGHLTVLDWYFTERGIDVDFLYPAGSLLQWAVGNVEISASLSLLSRYRARAAYPEAFIRMQPITALILNIKRYSDAAAEKMLTALISRDRSILDIACFRRDASVNRAAKYDDDTEMDDAAYCNPVFVLVKERRHRLLEFLLAQSLPGVSSLVNMYVESCLSPSDGAGDIDCDLTAAQFAAAAGDWESLNLLLRYTDARVTESFDSVPPVTELVHGHVKRPLPRALDSIIKARAKKELAEKAKPRPAAGTAIPAPEASATALAASASVVGSNAFEDPSLGAGGKARSKKKAKGKKGGKKRSKGKKRAVANAGAGGAPVDDSSSDDDEEDDFDEPDDNLVDSRYAPSLDLLLAQAAMKHEKPAETKEK